MLILEAEKAAFVHIPKTGGQSIQEALGVPFDRSERKQHGTSAPEGYFVFSFVRDPVTRFESAFRDTANRLAQGWGKRPDRLLNHPVRRFIHETKIAHVDDIVGFLEENPKAMRRDILFRPQTHWTDLAKPEFIGRFESMNEDFGRLLERLGRPPAELPRVNASPKKAEGLSPAFAARVRALYADDCNAFGY